MKKKYFGTDGIRNHVGQGMIRPENILKLGWATGKVIKNHGEKSVMIGKDTRISGYMFESALEAGFIAAGIDVYLLGPMPTPAIAYFTETFSCDAGVVISASHNPFNDNGIKYFSAEGRKISDEIELEIEAMVEQEIELVPSEHLGRAKRIDDAAGRYIEFCKSTYSGKTRLDGVKVVLDCANGATYHIAPSVYRELGAEVVVIGDQPDGYNINENCGATHLEALKSKVVSEQADIGIAFDGDGDRVMLVNAQGEVIDGDGILYLLACYGQTNSQGVVGTLMSNLGLEKALKAKGIDFKRASVGDRYVMEALMKLGWNYGAEPSGHVLCLDKISTGDGIIASLQIMSILSNTQKTLEELLAGLAVFPQILENVQVSNNKGIEDCQVLNQAIVEAEKRMAESGRVLIRASGTEPLIRVMVEGESVEMIRKEVEFLVNIVKSEFS